MPEFEIQALRRIYDALSRWDVDEFANDLTHDFELVLPKTVPWEEPATAGTAWRHTPIFWIKSREGRATRMTSSRRVT